MANKKRLDIPLNIQTLGIIVAALGSIAALISAWIQIAPGKPEVEARITSVEEFAARPDIEGLVGEFTYKGQQIKRLVTLRATIVNSGNKTIVGKGMHKNIIGDAITIDVPDSIKIVNAMLLSNEPNVISTNIERALQFSFNQWRPTESVELLIYLKADDEQISDYLIKKEREIIDGNFKFVNAISKKIEKNPLIDYMPSGYVKGLKAFGYLSIAIMFPLSIFLAIEAIKTRVQASSWKVINSNSFKLFVDEKLSFLPEEEREQIKSEPELMGAILWRQYDGDRPPSTLGDTTKESFLFAAMFFLISLGFLPLFVALHYLY